MATKRKPEPSRGPALFVRMNEKEMAAVERASKQAGFHTVSEFVRVTLKKALKDLALADG
jgi:hypothetical protein